MRVLLLSLLFIVTGTVFPQCVINETGSGGETLDVLLDTKTVTVISSCPQPTDYQYRVNIDYDVTASAAIFSILGYIDCDDDVAIQVAGFPFGSGTGTVSSNTATRNLDPSDCATATPASIGCDNLRIVVNGTGFSNETFICMITLPIDLIYFTAELKGSNALLKWATATELNNDFFTIEKSFNGIDFEPVENMDGAGTSLSEVSYEFLEEQTDENQGVVYYRVKQTDYDGVYDYTPIRAINFDKSQNRFYFDNDSNNLSIYSTNANYVIYTTSGSVVKEGRINGNNVDISTNNLPHSMYLVKVQNIETGITEVHKFSVD